MSWCTLLALVVRFPNQAKRTSDVHHVHMHLYIHLYIYVHYIISIYICVYIYIACVYINVCICVLLPFLIVVEVRPYAVVG